VCLFGLHQGHRLHRVLQPVAVREVDQLAQFGDRSPEAGHELGLRGHGTDAEGNPTTVEADHDHDPATTHVLRSGLQGGLRPDEVDDRVEGPIQLPGAHRPVGAQLEGPFPLLR